MRLVALFLLLVAYQVAGFASHSRGVRSTRLIHPTNYLPVGSSRTLQSAFLPSSSSVQLHPLERAKSSIISLFEKLRGDEVAKWRAAAFLFLSTISIFHKTIDIKLAHLWTHLITSQSLTGRIFRTDSWEWCLAVACFSVYIHGFMYADRAVRKASEQGRVHPWRKYRLQDRYEADKHHRMVETQPESTLEERDPPLKTQQSAWNVAAYVGEFWVYVLPLLTWDILSPRRHRRIANFAAPTTFQILGGIMGGLILYDLLFFCGHFLMHKIPFLYRTVHAKHHKVQEVRAGDIVRLSIVEEVS
jgi:sterol desaturase/sphingolipid hydroxylase (fatty acid hydroxylase superfamily)